MDEAYPPTPTSTPATEPTPQEQATRSHHRSKRTQVACTGCRKRQIKCQPLPGGPDCERCRKKGLKCEYIPIPKKTSSERIGRLSTSPYSSQSPEDELPGFNYGTHNYGHSTPRVGEPYQSTYYSSSSAGPGYHPGHYSTTGEYARPPTHHPADSPPYAAASMPLPYSTYGGATPRQTAAYPATRTPSTAVQSAGLQEQNPHWTPYTTSSPGNEYRRSTYPPYPVTAEYSATRQPSGDHETWTAQARISGTPRLPPESLQTDMHSPLLLPPRYPATYTPQAAAAYGTELRPATWDNGAVRSPDDNRSMRSYVAEPANEPSSSWSPTYSHPSFTPRADPGDNVSWSEPVDYSRSFQSSSADRPVGK